MFRTDKTALETFSIFLSMKRYFLFSMSLILALLASGCSCDNEAKPDGRAESAPPPPLVARPIPAELGVTMHLPVGATSDKPVAIVLAEKPSMCAAVHGSLEAGAHVLCSTDGSNELEGKLKRALAYLKKEYSPYVGPPPVWLLTDPSRAEVGFRLALAEPSFFSFAYLPGLPEKSLTATTLSALHERGARHLVLTMKASNRLKLLKNVASRRGLEMHFLTTPPGDVSAPLGIFRANDARLSPSKTTERPTSN